MKSVVFGVINTAPSTSVVNFVPVMSLTSSTPNATESSRQQVVPAAFTMSNWYMKLGSAPGGVTSYTFKIRKNGVDTALSITITGVATSGTDVVSMVSFAAGDIIDMSITPASTPAAPSVMMWNFNADSGATHFSLLLGGAHTTTNLSTAVAAYSQLTGASNGSGTWAATELTQQIICPTGGTISNLYVVADVAPGATKSYAIALVKNGVGSTLSATVSGTNTTGNDTTHTITVAAGDTLSISATPSTVPTVARYVWGLQFTPTNAGESFFGFGNANAPSTTTTQFEYPLGVGANGYNATESSRQLSIGQTTITAFYLSVGTAPGGVTTRTAMIRNNTANTAAAVTLTGVATTGNITGQSISIAQTDLQALQLTETGTPAADTNGVHMGVLAFIAVAAASGSAPTHMMMGMGS